MHETSYRLYTFAAGNYLSPLQNGLQTAHVVGDMSVEYSHDPIYKQWAAVDKVIVICNALNNEGVKNCYATLCTVGKATFGLPAVIFHEDIVSMNGMATACGIIVPDHLFDVTGEFDRNLRTTLYTHKIETESGTQEHTYGLGSTEHAFITLLKSYRLA